MKAPHSICLVSAVLCGISAIAQTSGPAKAAFIFREVGYFHRWSKADQHEFTPEKQEDLEKWTDMMTINGYPDVATGEDLAARANAVLENYKAARAMVLKTDSLPRTADRSAEHLIAVVFARPTFIEAAFARFRLVDGMGCSYVYSHRVYGEKAGDAMSAWLKANGAQAEKALMETRNMPSPKALASDALRSRT